MRLSGGALVATLLFASAVDCDPATSGYLSGTARSLLSRDGHSTGRLLQGWPATLRCRGGAGPGGWGPEESHAQALRAAARGQERRNKKQEAEIEQNMQDQLTGDGNGEGVDPALRADPSALVDDERQARDERALVRGNFTQGDAPGKLGWAEAPVVEFEDGDEGGFEDAFGGSEEEVGEGGGMGEDAMLDSGGGEGSWSGEAFEGQAAVRFSVRIR